MRSRPTFLALAARLFTGLVTIWCLGCSGYEPVLGSLIGGGGMSCASEMAVSASETGAGTSAAQATVGDASQSDHGFDCGCGSCHAASPMHWCANVERSDNPRVASVAAVEPLSVIRAPVAPPPEFAA
jgi:hypothetical protein